MMNSKIRRTLLLACCAVLLVVMSVGATLAYLTSQDSVVNTFTVGNIVITLDEAPVDVYGNVVAGNRTDANNYKLVPGHEYSKDPIIHVAANSEKCWLFVKVENEIAAIEDATTIADQMAKLGWKPIAEGSNIYYNETPVESKATVQDVTVFETFKVKSDADVAAYDGKTVKITAYAVQYDNFENKPVDAWNDTFGTAK